MLVNKISYKYDWCEIPLILFLFLKNYDTIIRNSRQNPRRKSTWRKNGFGTSESYPEE